MRGVVVTGIIISQIKYLSFSKLLAMYGFLMTILTVIVDLLYKLITGISNYVPTGTWTTWVVFAIALLILVPIIMFVGGFVICWILNIALRVANGLELETK